MFTTTHSEELLQCPLPPRPTAMDRRWKPNVEIAPNCPRCNSSNTKFCYYNNYSLTQPRYFCKACRRYWTKGGSLRNVPIGGGCRKNRRSRSVPISNNRVMNSSSYVNHQSSSGVVQNEDHLVNSSSSHNLPNSDNSTIDLALVYSKFLNQPPDDSTSGLVIPEFDPSFDVLSVSDNGISVSDPSPDTHPSEGVPDMFLGEFDLNYEEQERIASSQCTGLETNNYGLQPLLPSENLVIHDDIYWSNSPVVGSNYGWQPTQLQGFNTVIANDQSTLHSNSLDDSWSSFDLSNFDTFTRP